MAKSKTDGVGTDDMGVNPPATADPSQPTMEQLQADAIAARAQADAAAKDSARLQFIAESMSADADAKVQEANRAAAEADRQRALMEAQLAAANAATEQAKAALADAQAKAAADVAAAARDSAETAKRKAESLSESTKPTGASIRLEGGGFILVDPQTGLRDYRVLGLDGAYYEHVSNHPSGDWVYRNQDAG